VDQDNFLFASELKAFKKHPAFKNELDMTSVEVFLKYGYIPQERTIYRNVSKVLPGSILKYRLGEKSSIQIRPYWNIPKFSQKNDLNDQVCLEQLDALLVKAVQSQMHSDVPLGAFLSGGVDSSTVVSIMQESSTNRIKTFSIGFDDPRWNESHHARRIAEYLGTDHTEQILTGQDLFETVPVISDIFDEPFADGSQIPTLLVSRLAKTKVTVSLSGDGGDELFAGYDRYYWAKKLSEIPLHQLGAYLLKVLGQPGIQLLGLFDEKIRNKITPARVEHLQETLGRPDLKGIYDALLSQWRGRAPLKGLGEGSSFSLSNLQTQSSQGMDWMMGVDLVTYLPDDILVKVDRAAMSCSLETRVPLLDHRVVEYVVGLPLGMKYREGKSKWLLREVLKKRVPTELWDRPKMGFGVPIDTWLRGPLESWARDLLDPSLLSRQGILDSDVIQKTWQRHLSGKYDYSGRLWYLLMFQAWLLREEQSA
jgi:asparagine synthase (glutamine-hydrolysing)